MESRVSNLSGKCPAAELHMIKKVCWANKQPNSLLNKNPSYLCIIIF